MQHCYDQPALEQINAITAGFEWTKAMFIFRATYDYKGNIFFLEIVHSIVLDTGETFGIIPSEETRSHVLQNENFDLILLGDEGATADASDDEVISNSDIETGSKQRHKSGKGNAAAWLATMEGTKAMAKKVAGEHEKNKFWEECTTYDSRGTESVIGVSWQMHGMSSSLKERNLV
jgi:hypothetical protein